MHHSMVYTLKAFVITAMQGELHGANVLFAGTLLEIKTILCSAGVVAVN